MHPTSKTSRRGLWQRFQDSIPLQLFVAYAVAVLFYVGVTAWARASDCTPHDIEGQCGMPTLLGTLFAGIGATIIAAVLTIQIPILKWRRDQERAGLKVTRPTAFPSKDAS